MKLTELIPYINNQDQCFVYLIDKNMLTGFCKYKMIGNIKFITVKNEVNADMSHYLDYDVLCIKAEMVKRRSIDCPDPIISIEIYKKE